MRDTGKAEHASDHDVVLGEDWVSPEQSVTEEVQVRRARRSFFSLKGSPLTRKIITFNLIALIILVAGILYLNSSRQSLVRQKAGALVAEASLISDVFEAELPSAGAVSFATGDGIDAEQTLSGLTLRGGVEAMVFDSSGTMIASVTGVARSDALNALNESESGKTLISDGLSALWSAGGGLFKSCDAVRAQAPSLEEQLGALAERTLSAGATIDTATGSMRSIFTPPGTNSWPRPWVGGCMPPRGKATNQVHTSPGPQDSSCKPRWNPDICVPSP